jgi:hypothetical protein
MFNDETMPNPHGLQSKINTFGVFETGRIWNGCQVQLSHGRRTVPRSQQPGTDQLRLITRFRAVELLRTRTVRDPVKRPFASPNFLEPEGLVVTLAAVLVESVML